MTNEEAGLADMLSYFWFEKGNIERWASFNREEVAIKFPEVLKAWDEYKTSKRILNCVMQTLRDEAGNVT